MGGRALRVPRERTKNTIKTQTMAKGRDCHVGQERCPVMGAVLPITFRCERIVFFVTVTALQFPHPKEIIDLTVSTSLPLEVICHGVSSSLSFSLQK